jgi:hypothetical protein
MVFLLVARKRPYAHSADGDAVESGAQSDLTVAIRAPLPLSEQPALVAI